MGNHFRLNLNVAHDFCSSSGVEEAFDHESADHPARAKHLNQCIDTTQRAQII